MSVKVTLEFKSVDEAIVALGKIIGAPTAAPAAQQPAEKKERKPRADRGQQREPYGPRTTTGGPAASEPGQAGSSVPVTPAAPVSSTQTAAPVVDKAAPPAAATPVAAAPTDAVVQAAVERLFNAKDYDATIAVLSKFGVKRGKDLASDQRAEFIRRVDDILAGKYDALASWPQ